MKDEITKNHTEDKARRARRSDIEAAQERFDAIITMVEAVKWDDQTPEGRALKIIHRIADGATMDEIINEAGRAALGLGS